MSRIGKQPIKIPDRVEIAADGGFIIVKGPKGELKEPLLPEFKLEKEHNEVKILPVKPLENFSGLRRKKIVAMWGTERAIANNMIKGVVDGFEKKLELHGIGYRASLEGKKLVLNLGFSHPVYIEAPEEIEFKIEKNTVTISGIDKQLVGQVAAIIRSKKKPEPYKGKGIRYAGEVIKKKAGKKAAAK